MSLDKKRMVRTTVRGIKSRDDMICSYYYVFGYYILNIHYYSIYNVCVYTDLQPLNPTQKHGCRAKKTLALKEGNKKAD